MARELTARERYNLAERSRKEHWERHANNKTYEQWETERINQVHKMMDAVERMLEL